MAVEFDHRLRRGGQVCEYTHAGKRQHGVAYQGRIGDFHNRNRDAAHVRINLHKQVAARGSAAGIYLMDGTAAFRQRVQDQAAAESNALQQGTEDLAAAR